MSENTAGPALHVEELHAGYGKIPIVSALSFYVQAGEMLALLGRNGVGKTTTLHAIAGVRSGMNRGRVRLHGADVSAKRPHELTGAGMALVPEGRHVFPDMTVEENLEVGGFSARRRADYRLGDRREFVYELFPGLHAKRAQPVSQLSGGQQQMVAIGQALMPSPSVLLLDEPTAGIAPKLCDEIYAVLHTLAGQGTAIVIVDQSLERALHNADRYLVMDDGKAVATGSCATAGSLEAITEILMAEAKAVMAMPGDR